jgi:hypothetical protein
LATLPEGARSIDPAAEARRLGRERLQPSYGTLLLDEYRDIPVNGTANFVHITLTAEESFPVRADLGERIAALIREDLERDGGT